MLVRMRAFVCYSGGWRVDTAMNELYQLGELTREEARDLGARSTVVLPISSTEQHGPHLPLVTDALLAGAVASRAAKLAAASVPVVLAPMLPYGSSHHHLFASAMSLQSSTFFAVMNDLADSLVRSGFRRILLLNGHGGNDEVVKLVTKDSVLKHEVAVAACSYWQVAEVEVRSLVASKLGSFPGSYPGHSGWFETSMMLAVDPHLVRTDRLPDSGPEPVAFSHRGIARGLAVQRSGEWQRIGGYSDAPGGASAEIGEMMLNIIIEKVAEAIVAFHRAVDE
jgi:creatinine amidohydrolase